MAAHFPISPSIPIAPGTSPRLLEYQIDALERMIPGRRIEPDRLA